MYSEMAPESKGKSHQTSNFVIMSVDIKEILELLVSTVLFREMRDTDSKQTSTEPVAEQHQKSSGIGVHMNSHELDVNNYLDSVYTRSGDFDPRVTIELDILNQRNDAINKLELELDDARRTSCQMKKDHENQLGLLETKIGSSVKNAHLYYETYDDFIQANTSYRNAVNQFERVQNLHLSIKEFIDQIESMRFQHTLSPLWQKTLDDALMKVQDTKKEMVEIDKEVQHWQVLMEKIGLTLKNAEKGSKRTIKRARPYYELKKEFVRKEKEQENFIKQMENCVCEAKNEYQDALRSLEMISEEIHRRRLQGGDQNSEERTSAVYSDTQLTSSECNESNSVSNDIGFSSSDENVSGTHTSKPSFQDINSGDTVVSL